MDPSVQHRSTTCQASAVRQSRPTRLWWPGQAQGSTWPDSAPRTGYGTGKSRSAPGGWITSRTCLGVLEDSVTSQPILNLRDMCVRPVRLEFFFRECRITFDKDGKSEEALLSCHVVERCQCCTLVSRQLEGLINGMERQGLNVSSPLCPVRMLSASRACGFRSKRDNYSNLAH